MTVRVIDSPVHLKPVAAYSSAVRIGDLVAVAGQAGIDPGSERRVEGGITAEMRQTRANIETALASCGCTLGDVVRVDAFLNDLSDFDAFNAEYESWFDQPYPARTTVGANLLSNLAVEVTVLAVRPRGGR